MGGQIVGEQQQIHLRRVFGRWALPRPPHQGQEQAQHGASGQEVPRQAEACHAATQSDHLARAKPPAPLAQSRGNLDIEMCGGLIQVARQTPRKIIFVHGSIPLLRNFFANALMARWQWVFTLPSEHPMMRAASETSISSQ